MCISLASAQLTYHLDANTNSYTLQTPNSQQTFTQHFGRNNAGNQGAAVHQLQTAQSQSQPQQQVNEIEEIIVETFIQITGEYPLRFVKNLHLNSRLCMNHN